MTGNEWSRNSTLRCKSKLHILKPLNIFHWITNSNLNPFHLMQHCLLPHYKPNTIDHVQKLQKQDSLFFFYNKFQDNTHSTRIELQTTRGVSSSSGSSSFNVKWYKISKSHSLPNINHSFTLDIQTPQGEDGKEEGWGVGIQRKTRGLGTDCI